MATHMMNMSSKFHRNPSIKYRDSVPYEIGVDGQTTNGQETEWRSQPDDLKT